MVAYWVARAKINDPVEYKKYTDRVPAILAKYGGRVLVLGWPSGRVTPTSVMSCSSWCRRIRWPTSRSIVGSRW